MADLRIEYDDGLEEVLEKINAALESRGLDFRDDGQEHDGFCLYDLVEIDG